MTTRTKASIGLTGAAFLFGATFVVIKEAVEILPPLAFVGWRFLLGAAALFLFARPRSRAVWIDGTVAGLFLWAGYATQTMGLAETSASNSGLITGLYVVFTPLLAAVVRRQPPAIASVTGASLSIVGLALLTITAGFHLNSGDTLTVVCAIFFAAHIVLLSYLAPRHRVVPFTAVQLLVTAVLSLFASAIFEGFPIPDRSVLTALIVTGVVVSGGAFLMQVAAQTVLGPSRTAIILSAEPVFAAATAMVVLGERLTTRGWLGAVLIMIGVYIVLALSPPEDQDLAAAEAISEAH